MAKSVLSLSTNQPLPEQGPGIGRLYLIVDFVLLALTTVLVISLARIPWRYQRLAQRGIARRSDLARHAAPVLALHFIWPGAVLLIAAAGVPTWKVLAMFFPDLITWLTLTAGVVLLKGVVEIGLLLRIFTNRKPDQVSPGVPAA